MHAPRRPLALAAILLLTTLNVARAGERRAVTPFALPPETHARFDAVTGVTTVEFSPRVVYRDERRPNFHFFTRLSIFFQCAGDTVSAPDSVTLMLVHGAAQGKEDREPAWWWPAAGSHWLRILVDSTRVDYGTMTSRQGQGAEIFLSENDLNGAPGWDAVPELLALTLPRDRAIAFCAARSTQALVDGLRFFPHNSSDGNDVLYHRFGDYLVELGNAPR